MSGVAEGEDQHCAEKRLCEPGIVMNIQKRKRMLHFIKTFQLSSEGIGVVHNETSSFFMGLHLKGQMQNIP